MLTTDGMRFAGVPRVLCVVITVALKKSVATYCDTEKSQ
jgi:hypothetical protein